jgi:hypothetical protein
VPVCAGSSENSLAGLVRRTGESRIGFLGLNAALGSFGIFRGPTEPKSRVLDALSQDVGLSCRFRSATGFSRVGHVESTFAPEKYHDAMGIFGLSVPGRCKYGRSSGARLGLARRSRLGRVFSEQRTADRRVPSKSKRYCRKIRAGGFYKTKPA